MQVSAEMKELTLFRCCTVGDSQHSLACMGSPSQPKKIHFHTTLNLYGRCASADYCGTFLLSVAVDPVHVTSLTQAEQNISTSSHKLSRIKVSRLKC